MRTPKDADVVPRLTMWSIDEMVEIDLYQSVVLSPQWLKCLAESIWRRSQGRSRLVRLEGWRKFADSPGGGVDVFAP